MSFNQSRSDKSDAQYRKTGRSASSNQKRSSSGSFPMAGRSGPAPSPALSSSSNRSYKRPKNVQGGQSRVNVPAGNSPSDFGGRAPRSVQNGAHVRPQLHGVSDAPAAKPADSSATQKSARGVLKAPSSQSTTMSSETKAPTTPLKGDASKPFAFQLGSISPGFMNEMQIPARTSSAPPNLDDQNCDQARRSVPPLPMPSVPKQQLPRKDAGAVDQSNSGVDPPIPMARKEMQVSSAPSTTQTQKPSALPMPGISMPLPYNQPLVPVQFGGPHPQMQSQTMTATSLQMPMPMPLPMGSAPQVQQQVFVSGLQPHPLQPQGIMHQGQGLSFTTQMGSQLPPQLGNLGIGISPQYPQQKGGKYGGPRKTTAKITHPDTHEELRLDKRIDTYSDGRSTAKITHPYTHEELRLDERIDTYSDGGSTGLRSHPTVLPQSQPMPSFGLSHPMNYYPNSYNASSVFFPPPGSLPVTGSQIPPNSQASRFNYPVNQGPQNVSFMNPPAHNSLVVNKARTPVHSTARPSSSEHTCDAHNVITSTPTTIPVTIKPAAGAIGEKVVDSSLSNNSPAAEWGESQKVSGPLGEASSSHRDTENSESSLQHFKPGSESFPSNASNPLKSASTAPSEESVSVVINAEGGKKASVSRLTSIKDHQKKLGKKRHTQPQHQHEVGKATDEKQAKQRQWKSILNKLRQLKSILNKLRQLKSINKLTSQNFEKLFEQVKAVNIDNAMTLAGFTSQIFDMALIEPTFCEMYANFCYHLAGELPDFSEDNEKITFKRLLLNKCQEEFERGEREQEEANIVDEEGEVKQSEEESEEKRIKARRRMLGNIRLIGELYKKKMLTERIMHECIKKLLGQYQNPDEEDVEALCELMSTIGEMIDHPKAKEHIDAYFDMMAKLSNNMKLSSRVRFMLKDSIDLRNNKWQQKSKVEGPKKIEELHRDAGQERQAQARGLACGPGVNPSRRRAPMEFGPRGATMLSSPNAQMGSFRGLSIQARGYGAQDVRTKDKQSYEAKTLSVPLLQRPIGEDSITLGPEGGLARGTSIRGPPAMPGAPLADVSPSPGDNRRMMPGLNGYSSVSERTTYGQREDLIPRYIPDRFASPAAYDQSSAQERNVNYSYRDHRNPDRGFDRLHASPAARGQVPSFTQNLPLEKAWPEERLREMSMAAIKEFYSARDEKEVALCIKELNSPSFYPSMISLWVTDSFERKDMERDLLAKLLVNLTKSQDGTLSQGQLIKGFESVLTTLEDAVIDAPKAPEFLARILARVILENVIPLREIGLLIYEGGDEPGHLREIGIAADILGSILETIKPEKGETVFR